MSIQADDEFNLRLALMSELDDVAPRDELAGLIITRHRKVRRLRFAGVCGLFVVFAGIGVPIGIASTSGGGAPAKAGPAEVALRLGTYTLTLPGQYHASGTDAAPCAAATQPPAGSTVEEVAAVTSGVCILMFVAPPGYAPPRTGSTVVVSEHGENLVIGAAGLSRTRLDSLVSAGLRSAA